MIPSYRNCRDCIRSSRKVHLEPSKERRKLGLVWRNRMKIIQIIIDYLYLPFFLLIILWWEISVKTCNFKLAATRDLSTFVICSRKALFLQNGDFALLQE
jgi:hypothetical protein